MNTIKITSGKYRGRSLKAPGGATHPMGAREKLALFNIISSYLPEATVLDAYAGSGALGIEALSRGAKEAVFIEKNAQASQVIRENLTSLGLVGEIFRGAVRDFASKKHFQVILADPPYDKFNPEEVGQLVKFLADGGILVLSHPGEAPEITGLTLIKTSQYAAAHISIYH